MPLPVVLEKTKMPTACDFYNFKIRFGIQIDFLISVRLQPPNYLGGPTAYAPLKVLIEPASIPFFPLDFNNVFR